MFVAFSIFLMVLFGTWWSLWLSTGPSPHFGTLAGQLQLGVPRSDFCIHHSICHVKRSMLSWWASGCTSEHAQQKWETYGNAFLNNSDYNSLVRKYVSSELSLAWLGKGVRLECSVGAVARWVLRRWSVYKRESNQTMFVRWKLHRWDMGEAPANTKYIWPGCQTKQSSSVVPVGGISALACNFVMFCLLEDYITPEMQSVVEPLIWCANLIKVAICVCKGECATRDRKGCQVCVKPFHSFICRRASLAWAAWKGYVKYEYPKYQSTSCADETPTQSIHTEHTAGKSSATGFWDTHILLHSCLWAVDFLGGWCWTRENCGGGRQMPKDATSQRIQKDLLYSFLLGLRCFRGRLSRLGQTWSTVARKSQQCVFERLAKSASDLSSYRHDSVPFSTYS